MGSFKYIRENERKIYEDRGFLLKIQGESITVRVDRPTKLTKAKSLGYKAKQGYIIVRTRVAKGSYRRPRPTHARRPSKTGLYFNLDISKKKIAEFRASRVYKNMQVLGSYLVAKNGQYDWFEIVMKDPILADNKSAR